MRNIALSVLLMALCVLGVRCSNHGVVAKGGDFVLTVEDLRFEVRNLGASYRFEDTFENRKALVDNIAARFFLAQEAARMGGETEDILEAVRMVEAGAVARAYREWKIEKAVSLPRVKQLRWRPRLDRNLRVKEMIFTVYPVAHTASALLRGGMGFDDVAARFEGAEGFEQRDLGWKVLTDIDRRMAGYIFRVTPGEATEIVKGPDGYHVAYVLDDQPAGLDEAEVALRTRGFLRAVEEQRLLDRERAELTKMFGLRFAERGLGATLESFAISFRGGMPPDSLLNQLIATYDLGVVTVDRLYNNYYSLPYTSRPYVGDYHGIEDFTFAILLPELRAAAGYAMGLDRLRSVIWQAKNAREEALVHLMEEYFRGQIEISEEEKQEYYDRRKQDLMTQAQYRARRILLETEDEVKEVKRELEAGEDFARIAMERSHDKATSSKGGDLGNLYYGLIAPYDSVIANLRPGEISGVFTTSDGLEILKLEEIVEPQQLSFDEAESYIETFIGNTRANQLLKEWIGASMAEVGFSIDENLLAGIALPEPEVQWVGKVGD